VTRESPHPDLQGVGAMYQTKPLQDGTKSMPERQRAAWIGAAVVAASLTLAGCSGSSGTPSPNPIAPTSSVAAAAPTSSAPPAKPGTITSVSDGRDFMAKAFPGLTCDQGMPESSPSGYGHKAFPQGTQGIIIITCGPPDTAYTMYLDPSGSTPTLIGGAMDHTQRFSTASARGPNFVITSEGQSVHGLCSASVRTKRAFPEGLVVSPAETSSLPVNCPQSSAPVVNTGSDGHDLMTKAFPAMTCDEGMPVTPSTSTGNFAQASGGPVAAFRIFPTAKTITLVTCKGNFDPVYLYISSPAIAPSGDGFSGGVGIQLISANGPNYVVVGEIGAVCTMSQLPGKPDIQGTVYPYDGSGPQDTCFLGPR